MRTLAAIALVITVAVWPHCVWGQPSQFPYEAEVRGDDVNVRSGPSLKNYETGKLNQGDRVTVIRHDPGGWFAIAPPPGSVSWIDAKNVQKIDERTGIVRVPPQPDGTPAQAIVRIGSSLSDDCSLLSVRLENDDRVEILGEKMLDLDRGPVLMYQITPPAEEFRWVKGDFIVPLGAAERGPGNGDPFALPRKPKRPDVNPQAFAETPRSDLAHVEPAHEATAPVAPLSGDLEVLDGQLKEMLAKGPEQWRLEEFEQHLQQMLPMSDPVNRALIRQRLATIATRKRARDDYLDFVRLTGDTTQREQQLQAMQFGGLPAQQAGYPQVQLQTPQPIPDGAPTSASMSGQPPGATDRQGPRLAPIPDRAVPASPGGPVLPRFDGAGIVQRSGNPLGTVPPYVLIAPNGKLLSFLEPAAGTDLAPYVGQSVGVIGKRSFDGRLQSDRIVVKRLQPVQLAP